jgi:hypothetical protein
VPTALPIGSPSKKYCDVQMSDKVNRQEFGFNKLIYCDSHCIDLFVTRSGLGQSQNFKIFKIISATLPDQCALDRCTSFYNGQVLYYLVQKWSSNCSKATNFSKISLTFPQHLKSLLANFVFLTKSQTISKAN